ncbi:MAG: hypothetical protein AAGB01_05300 [Cyanobacteria bacterium P01_F01_bin.42]
MTSAVGLALLATRISRIDRIYGISIGGAGVLSGLWGFAIAPIPIQVSLEVLLFGWMLRSRSLMED